MLLVDDWVPNTKLSKVFNNTFIVKTFISLGFFYLPNKIWENLILSNNKIIGDRESVVQWARY